MPGRQANVSAWLQLANSRLHISDAIRRLPSARSIALAPTIPRASASPFDVTPAEVMPVDVIPVDVRPADVIYLFSVGIRVFDNLKEQKITTETQRHRDEFQEDYSVLLLCVTVSLW